MRVLVAAVSGHAAARHEGGQKGKEMLLPGQRGEQACILELEKQAGREYEPFRPAALMYVIDYVYLVQLNPMSMLQIDKTSAGFVQIISSGAVAAHMLSGDLIS